jgi:DNA-binding NarL/FixJ family response regulator
VKTSIQVAVAHRSAAYRDGIAQCVRAIGMEPVEPADLRAWSNSIDRGVALVHAADAAGLELVSALAGEPGVLVVALVDDLHPSTYAEPLKLGADGVAHADSSPEIICRSLEAAVGGEVVLPAEAAKQMARLIESGEAQPSAITDEEIGLLQRLSDGVSIVDLAKHEFLAERTMRRRLQNLYLKLGVQGRAQALKRAARLRMIE